MDQWGITILGGGGVGKTALVQFAFNGDIEPYDRTIEDAYRKQMDVDNRMSFVEAIDTAGEEEYATAKASSSCIRSHRVHRLTDWKFSASRYYA